MARKPRRKRTRRFDRLTPGRALYDASVLARRCVGLYIAHARGKQTQEECAKKSGLSIPTIRRIESGETVERSSLTKLMKALDLSVEERKMLRRQFSLLTDSIGFWGCAGDD